MNELFAKTIPLALGAIVSPTVLAAVILVLTGKVSPRARAWAFFIGGCAALAAFTAAVPWVAKMMDSISPVVVQRGDVILGLLLVALAVRKVVKGKAPGSETTRAPKHKATAASRLGEYFGFGAVMIATDMSSLVLYLAIMREAGQSHAAETARIAVVAMGYLAVMLPALVPACIASIAPKQTELLLVPLGAWSKKHSTAITVVICSVFAAYLLAKGLAPLFHK